MIITIRIPAFWHSTIAAGTDSLTGSVMPINPTKIKLKSCCLSGRGTSSENDFATPKPLRPSLANLVSAGLIADTAHKGGQIRHDEIRIDENSH